MSKICLVVLLCWGWFAVAQSSGEILLEGRARVFQGEARSIHLQNLRTKKVLETDLRGYFSIAVQLGDHLAFWSDGLNSQTVIITQSVVDHAPLEVYLSSVNQNLQEIVIDRKGVSAKELGVSAAKTYSPAERRARAGNKMFYGLFNHSLDPVFTLLSGRRKMLKKAVVLEAIELKYQRFTRVYPPHVIQQLFALPEDLVSAFVYFVVEKPDYKESDLDSGLDYELQLAQLSVEFKNLYQLN